MITVLRDVRQAFPAERQRLGLPAAGGQVRPGRHSRVAEEDASAFRRGVVRSGLVGHGPGPGS
jgi:hypothetical protein